MWATLKKITFHYENCDTGDILHSVIRKMYIITLLEKGLSVSVETKHTYSYAFVINVFDFLIKNI